MGDMFFERRLPKRNLLNSNFANLNQIEDTARRRPRGLLYPIAMRCYWRRTLCIYHLGRGLAELLILSDGHAKA